MAKTMWTRWKQISAAMFIHLVEIPLRGVEIVGDYCLKFGKGIAGLTLRFSHMMYGDKSPGSKPFCCSWSDSELRPLCWGCRWPTSATGASPYHAGLLNTWCRLSRVPLTHFGQYLPPSRSLEKQGIGNLLQHLSLISFPDLFDSYSTAVIRVCHHLLCLFIKGRMDKIELWANSVAACHDRKQLSRYNPYPIHLKELSGVARYMQEVCFMASETGAGGSSDHAFTSRRSNLSAEQWQSYHKSNICIIDDSASQVTSEANYLCIVWRLAMDKPYRQ